MVSTSCRFLSNGLVDYDPSTGPDAINLPLWVAESAAILWFNHFRDPPHAITHQPQSVPITGSLYTAYGTLDVGLAISLWAH